MDRYSNDSLTYESFANRNNRNRRREQFHSPDNSNSNEDHQRVRSGGALEAIRYLYLLLEFEEVRTLTMSLDVVQKCFFLNHLRVAFLCYIFVDTDLHRLLRSRGDEYGMDTIRQICVEAKQRRRYRCMRDAPIVH